MQSIVLATRGVDVLSVEVSQDVIGLLECNLAFAGVTGQVTVRNVPVGNFDDVNGVFDYICANPPLVPIGRYRGYPHVGAGGVDGFKVGREVLRVINRNLSSSGSFQMLGMTIGGPSGSTVLDEIHTWACTQGFSTTLMMLRRFSLGVESEYIKNLARTYLTFDQHLKANHEDNDFTHLCQTLNDELTADGSEWVYTFVLSGRRRNKSILPIGVTTIDLLDSTLGFGSWWL